MLFLSHTHLLFHKHSKFMQKMFFFLFFVLLLQEITLNNAINSENVATVIYLTDSNFSTYLNNSPLTLVQFYAPWCGHCKKVENDFQIAAERLEELKLQCSLAKYDGGENREFVKSLGIKGYPSYLLFRNGIHISTYNGPRYSDDIVEYMIAKASPVAVEITSIPNLENFLAQNAKSHHTDTKPSFAILGLFHPDKVSEGPEPLSAFESLANLPIAQNFLLAAELGDNRLKFAISTAKSVIESFGLIFNPREGCLVSLMYPPAKPNPVLNLLPIDASVQKIQEIIARLSAPMIVPFSPSFYREMQSSFSPTWHILVFCDEKFPVGEQCLNLVEELAPHYQGRLLFVTVSHAETHLYKTFSIDISPTPKIVGIKMNSHDSYSRTVMEIPKLDENEEENINDESLTNSYLTESTLVDFINGFLFDDLPPQIISEELEPNEKTSLEYSPMHKVVASNFDTLVIKSFQHFLLFVVAPWCGHCKSIEPVIRSIGKYIYSHSIEHKQMTSTLPPPQTGPNNLPSMRRGLFVGKIDGTKNDINYPGVVIRGYPTILIFKKFGSGENQSVEVIPYHGERTVNNVIKFLENQDVWKVFLHENQPYHHHHYHHYQSQSQSQSQESLNDRKEL